MNKNTQGTIVLDGMIEGRLPSDAKAAETVRHWVEFAKSVNLHFNFEGDGGTFSILADNKPVEVSAIGPDPVEVISSALGEVLKAFAPGERSGLFSTLRSVEYRKGEEVQTVYVIKPAGPVQAKQRTVASETVAPPAPVSARERFRVGVYAVIAVLIVFGISAFFVDFQSLYRNMRHQAAGFKAEEIAVDGSGFEKYFMVEKKRVNSGGDALILTLRRTGEFPLSDADVNKATTQPLTGRMTLEAVVGGYLHCESFEEKGAFIDTRVVRIRELRTHETVDVSLPLSRDPRTARVLLTY